MPRDGSGVWSAPAGTTATAGTPIESAKYNALVADIANTFNAAIPILQGGTGASTAPAALANLGGLSSTTALAALAPLTPAADRLPYFTSGSAATVAPLTAFARTILDDADAAAVRATIGAQASDGALTTLAGLSLVQGDILYATGPDTVARLGPGTSGQVLRTNGAGANPSWATVSGGAPDFVLEDQKPSGTSAQAPTLNTWVTRDLNTEVRDVANIVSTTASEFTVTANCWVEWTVPGRDSFQTRLFNVTDAVVAAVGETTGSSGTGTRSNGGGACAAGKTYRIEHNTNSTQISQNARGVGTEVYTRVLGWRT